MRYQHNELNKNITALDFWCTTKYKYVWQCWIEYHRQQQAQKQQYKFNMLKSSGIESVDTVLQNPTEIPKLPLNNIYSNVPNKTNGIHTARNFVASTDMSPNRRFSMPVRSKSTVTQPIKPIVKQRTQPRNSLAINNNALVTLPSRSNSLAVPVPNAVVNTAETEIASIETQLQQYTQHKQQYLNNKQQYQQYITIFNKIQSNDISIQFTYHEIVQLTEQCEVLAEQIQLYDINKQNVQNNVKKLMQRLQQLTQIVE